MIAGLLAAVICFILFLATIIAWFHRAPGVHRFGAMARAWLVLLLIYLPVYFFVAEPLTARVAAPLALSDIRGAVNFLNGMVVFTLMYLSFCVLYSSDHGLSLAFMFELEAKTDKRMTLAQLIQRFPYDAMLRGRLSDLEANGFVIRKGEHFRLASKGNFIAWILGGLKRFLKLEPGG